MKLSKVLLTVSLLIVCSIGPAAPIQLQAIDGRTEFVALGKPAMLRIAGKGTGPQGTLKVDGVGLSGELTVNMASLTTGIDLRDDHMKNKYLEVVKFPVSKLIFEKSQLASSIDPLTEKKADLPFSGQLNLHGITKPIDGKYTITPDGKNFNVVATYSINLSDFKIDIPSYMGIKVADKVNIEANFTLKR